MTKQVTHDNVMAVIGFALTETFESVNGVYLDKGTSLFETLAEISAEDASIPVGGNCATIAAQVEHVRYYLDVLEQYTLGNKPENVNWSEIWETVSSVTADEWADSIEHLKTTYQRVRNTIETMEDWSHQMAFGGVIGIIAHTAYHLGEIRQALCVVRK